MIKRIIIEQSKDGKKERRKKKLVNKLTQRGIVGTWLVGLRPEQSQPIQLALLLVQPVPQSGEFVLLCWLLKQ